VEHERCVRCILPRDYPVITLDEHGVCTFCRDYEPYAVRGEDALWETVEERRGEKYDVLVPASGGRDSTYVLYKAAQRLGKRVLALHFDNEFQVAQARENFLEAARRTGVDYKIVRSKRSLSNKIVRNAVKSSLSDDTEDIVANVCAACTYGYMAASYREAKRSKIPTILWGGSDAERRRFHAALSGFAYYKRRAKFLFSSRFFNFLAFVWYMVLFQREFRIPNGKLIYLKKPKYEGKDVLEVKFYDYVAWDRREIKRVITEQMGWKVPSGKVSSWRYDCRIHDLINYCYRQKFGFSMDVDGYANMVRAGSMDRQKALWQEEQLGFMSPELLRMLREDLRLSDAEICRYFKERNGESTPRTRTGPT